MLSFFVVFPYHHQCQPVLIVFLFFFRSRTLLLVRRTCRRRKPFCDGPRRQHTSTPESTSKTSPSHGGTGSPSMPSSTETGDKMSDPGWIPSTKSLFLPSCEGVSLSAAALWWQQMTTETGGWEVTDSAAKSVSLSATVVACHNNTKFGRSHNFQLITAAH